MEDLRQNRYKLVVLLFGIFVSSFGVLTFEISLTRIFSLMYSYHYTFLAVSIALFALSLGGILGQAFSRKKTPPDNIFNTLSRTCLIFSFTTFLIVATLSFPSLGMLGDMFLMFFPLFIAGFLLATIYKFFVNVSGVVYFADLLGASMGALAVVFLLNFAGAARGILLVSIIISIASLFFAIASKRKKIIFISIAGIILLAFFAQFSNYSNLLNIGPMNGQAKELANFLSDQSLGAKIVDSRWSAFGRTDLVETKADSHFKTLFVDGGAGTKMFHFDGDFNSSDSEVASLKNATQYFPYYFANKGSSLVIGPGGGLDVLTSLMSGMNHTTAVEVNPDIVGIVRDYSDYNGGIYTKYSNVHVFVDEGRSFVKRNSQKYDIIMLDIPITKTSQGTTGYALAENYLFTTNSFMDFLDHLNNDGFLSIVAHERAEVYKLVTILLKLFEDRGFRASELMQRIVVVAGTGHSGLPVLIFKKTPFTSEQTTLMYTKSSDLQLVPVYLPHINDSSLDPLLSDLGNGKVSIDQVISMAPFDLSPPSDDDPFFYKFELGIPVILWQLLVGAIIMSAIVSGLYIRVYIKAWISRRQSIRAFRRLRHMTWKKSLLSRTGKLSLFRPYYFASLGLGYMLIEIPLTQRFILFLGHPTFALTAVLFSLLLSSSLGSFYSRKWKGSKLNRVFSISLLIGILVIFQAFALPFIFNMFLSYESAVRFLISFLLIFPLGFLMGIPFPTGLRMGAEEFEGDVAWMWGINGAFSVLGSVLAFVAAMSFNFTTALLLGVLAYFGIFLFGEIWGKSRLSINEIRKHEIQKKGIVPHEKTIVPQ